MGAEGPAGLLQALQDGLDRFDLRGTVCVEGGPGRVVRGDVDIVLRAVAQDSLISRQRKDGLGAVQ